MVKSVIGFKNFSCSDLNLSPLDHSLGRLGHPDANHQIGSPGLKASRRALSNGDLPQPGVSLAHLVPRLRLGARVHGTIRDGI